MSSFLHNTSLLDIITHSIASDKTIKDVANAIDPLLKNLSLTSTDLLLWARLLETAKINIPQSHMPPMRRLIDANGGLKLLDTTILEVLAWQLHVDFREIAKDDLTLAKMVANSIPWHRIKGTPASVREALNLFGYNVVRIEENDTAASTVDNLWATYQIELDSPQDREIIEHIYEICQEMQPVRSKLWRMYNDLYDWRPGIWSGGAPDHGWSYFWWSLFSGVPVEGIAGVDGDHDLIVSFGARDLFQSEPYIFPWMHAGWNMEQGHAFRIPYIDRPFWSYSSWSDLYKLQAAFAIGELIVLLAGVYLGDPWEGEWGDKIWGVTKWIDRYLPPWIMPYRSWAKSQIVLSEPHKDGGYYGDINSNYSIPLVYHFIGDAPIWSKYIWSEDERQVIVEKILEQYYHRYGYHGSKIEPLLEKIVSSRLDAFIAHGVYPDHPIWSRYSWSDAFPRVHQFFRLDWTGALAANPVYADNSWGDQTWSDVVDPGSETLDSIWSDFLWSDSGWSSRTYVPPTIRDSDLTWDGLIGYDRAIKDFDIFDRSISKSQLVESEPHDDGSKYGDINSNYTRPHYTYLEGEALKYSVDLVWGNDSLRAKTVFIDEQYQEETSIASKPETILDDGHAAIEEVFPNKLAGHDHPVWSEFTWSDTFPQQHSFFREDATGAIAATPIYVEGGWDDRTWDTLIESGQRTIRSFWGVYVWSENLWTEIEVTPDQWAKQDGTWGGVEGYERPQAEFGLFHLNWSKSQLVWNDSFEPGSMFGDINANYSRPVYRYLEGDAGKYSENLAWSEESQRAKEIVIDEQRQDVASYQQEESDIPECSPSARHDEFVGHTARRHTLVWGEFAWSDHVERHYSFFREDATGAIAAERIPTGISWPDEPWGELQEPEQIQSIADWSTFKYSEGSWTEVEVTPATYVGDLTWASPAKFERHQDDFDLRTLSLAKSQLVESEPLPCGSRYGDINSNYSVPTIQRLGGDSPVWSSFGWSKNKPRVIQEKILEQRQDTISRQVATDGLADGCQEGREELLGTHTKRNPYCWSDFAYSDAEIIRNGDSFREDATGSVIGKPVYRGHGWNDDTWDDLVKEGEVTNISTWSTYVWSNGQYTEIKKGPDEWAKKDGCWGEVVGYEQEHDDFEIASRSNSKSQLVHAEPHDEGSKYGDINSAYGVPCYDYWDKAPKYSTDFVYSESYQSKTRVRLDKQSRETIALIFEQVEREAPKSLTGPLFSIQSEPVNHDSWFDGWNDRRWLGWVGYSDYSNHTIDIDLHNILHIDAQGVTVLEDDMPLSSWPDLHSIVHGLASGLTILPKDLSKEMI